ncbi:MAG: hypothetical protein MI867_18240, partial [Pseudomonadales bacterium]|nr:hypothetical protein [Pseudomonadales bacterium]
HEPQHIERIYELVDESPPEQLLLLPINLGNALTIRILNQSELTENTLKNAVDNELEAIKLADEFAMSSDLVKKNEAEKTFSRLSRF